MRPIRGKSADVQGSPKWLFSSAFYEMRFPSPSVHFRQFPPHWLQFGYKVHTEVPSFSGTASREGKVVIAEAQSPEPHHDPVTALEVAVLRLNHRQQLITGCPGEVVRSCQQIHDPIFLRRSPRNEREFAEFITALGRWLYDGTNGVTSVQDRGAVKPTLPSWCYRDHRSVVVHVIALRNHYLHGLSPNDTTAAEHLASAGDVFQIYTAKRVPDDRDFAAMRVRLLAAATRLVNWLAAHVPVREAANAETVFTDPNGHGGGDGVGDGAGAVEQDTFVARELAGGRIDALRLQVLGNDKKSE